jgi:hypothetical protein
MIYIPTPAFAIMAFARWDKSSCWEWFFLSDLLTAFGLTAIVIQSPLNFMMSMLKLRLVNPIQ